MRKRATPDGVPAKRGSPPLPTRKSRRLSRLPVLQLSPSAPALLSQPRSGVRRGTAIPLDSAPSSPLQSQSSPILQIQLGLNNSAVELQKSAPVLHTQPPLESSSPVVHSQSAPVLHTQPQLESSSPVVHSQSAHDVLQTQVGSSFSASELQESSSSSLQCLSQHEQHLPESFRNVVWSQSELKGLIEFMIAHMSPTNCWPDNISRKLNMWSSAAKFVNSTASSQQKRSAGACRAKVKSLMKRFATPNDAEEYYFADDHNAGGVSDSVNTPASHEPQINGANERDNAHDADIRTQFSCLSPSEQLSLLSDLLKTTAAHHNVSFPSDFLALSISAASHLKTSGHPNVVYGLVKALGRMRPDGSDSRLPVKRMPMGLLEYIIGFYNADTISEVPRCPNDYRQWTSTMYSCFGTKWIKLFRGPMWCVEPIVQGEAPISVSQKPVEARANVPTICERTIRNDIAASAITLDASIQLETLDEAAKVHAGSCWWIKADGCDVVQGLRESVRLEWSGDVDMNDGKLKKMHSLYLKRLNFIASIGLDDRKKVVIVKQDLALAKKDLDSDICFILSNLKEKNGDYSKKFQAGNAKEKSLYSLGWSIEELSNLLENGRKLSVELAVLQEMQMQEGSQGHEDEQNVARKLTNVRKKLQEFVKGVSHYKRQPATHVFVVMISTEQRAHKPYALPVQCLSYSGLTCDQARKIVNDIVEQMVAREMKVAGFVTDGEFNSLRLKGSTRPLSILQLKATAKQKYSSIGQKNMLSMLTPIRSATGEITAKVANPCVSHQLLVEIQSWLDRGVTMKGVVDRLRPRTVPLGYEYHNWRPDEDEEMIDKLRSILAQLEYSYQVQHWHEQGVPFRTHMYVPEINALTGAPFHEREDDAHILKRIANCLRSGHAGGIQLERFVEALEDPSSKLTYPALSGQRKQSVKDAEHLLSHEMVDFMERRNYTAEAEYIKVIANWRLSSDERGLSELQRSRYNYQLLNFLLDELMPWHSENYDFSLLEVNRDVTHIRGMTREVLVALTTNIESREWRRRDLVNESCHPEHPRASTTDDVECFFSVARDMVGRNFTVKDMLYAWRKISLEYAKRADPELPFYYYTSSHDRFYEGPRASFNIPCASKSNPRHQRVRRVEQPACLLAGRASLPTSGAMSTRMEFHNKPVDLLPPPSLSYSQLSEHSYAKGNTQSSSIRIEPASQPSSMGEK